MTLTYPRVWSGGKSLFFVKKHYYYKDKTEMSCEAAKQEFGEISPMQAAPFLMSMLSMGKLRGEGKRATTTISPHCQLSMASSRTVPIYNIF